MKKKSPPKQVDIIHVGNKPITATLDGSPLGLMPSRSEMQKPPVREAEGGYERGEWEW